jgi:hypothetical protein
MATPQLAPVRVSPRAPLPQTPKSVFCHHQHRDGQFCNRSAHGDLRYCLWHLDSLGKKLKSLYKSTRLYLRG